jgi:hypothetical protein
VAVDWTLAEAAGWLHPAVSEDQLRELVHALRIAPVPAARAPRGQAGRPARRYLAVEIMSLHAAVAPWLIRSSPPAPEDEEAGGLHE